MKKKNTEVVILGSGPGGYSAAFRCADLGLKTVLIEKNSYIGGVCLNMGCIPSKTLLNLAKIIKDVKTLNKSGISCNISKIDISKIKIWKNQVISKLRNGLNLMAKSRKIKIIHGYGIFKNKNLISIKENNSKILLSFKNAIIATGSSPIELPMFPKDDYFIWNSTEALKIKRIPNKLLIIGGGVIGLEMATIYKSLGSKIEILEMSNNLLNNLDKDVSDFYKKEISSCFKIYFKSRIMDVKIKNNFVKVKIKNKKNIILSNKYDAILVSVGRKPNTNNINLNKININLNEKGFIKVNKQMRTNIKNIFAIGDCIGHPMLAHKSTYQAHIAAEVISGKNHFFNPLVIPNITYTIPEIASVGLTEKQAKEKNIDYKVALFPWYASGKAVASNHFNGITKLIFDKNSDKIIGGFVIGINGGELLGEISLAIEMGCNSKDIALTIHSHPTLYETIGRAAEVYEKTITDL